MTSNGRMKTKLAIVTSITKRGNSKPNKKKQGQLRQLLFSLVTHSLAHTYMQMNIYREDS